MWTFDVYLNQRLRDKRLEGLVKNLFRPSYGGNRNFTLMYTLGALLVSVGIGAISIWVVITTPWQVRDTLLDIPTAEAIGGLMLTRYVLPFEIASLLLTVALIGAIVIAREE